MPGRAEADSHVNRRSISPVREIEDSRSRRALQMQDPRSRARADSSISVSPNRDEGRNRSPRAADREPEVRSRESSERPIRNSNRRQGDTQRNRTFQVLVMAEGTQLLAARQVAMDLTCLAYALRTTRTIAGAQMRVSPVPVLLADVSSASYARVMMETVGIASY